MEIISQKIVLSSLKTKYMEYFTTMIKADVDVDQRIMAIDAELHSDLEALLLDQGSKQEHIWGINLYPDKTKTDCIEYTSLINIRPAQENRSMEVEDQHIRETIRSIVEELIDFES